MGGWKEMVNDDDECFGGSVRRVFGAYPKR
jgi:hypothetical protein